MKVLESLEERFIRATEYIHLIPVDDKIKDLNGWTIADLESVEREIKDYDVKSCIEPKDLPELISKADSLVDAEYVQNVIHEAYDQMVAGFAFASTFLIPTDDSENTNHVNLNNSIEYIIRTSTVAMEYLYYNLKLHKWLLHIGW